MQPIEFILIIIELLLIIALILIMMLLVLLVSEFIKAQKSQGAKGEEVPGNELQNLLQQESRDNPLEGTS